MYTITLFNSMNDIISDQGNQAIYKLTCKVHRRVFCQITKEHFLYFPGTYKVIYYLIPQMAGMSVYVYFTDHSCQGLFRIVGKQTTQKD